MEPISIKSSPLPSLSKEDPLTKDQWRTLLAIADTIVPAIVENKKDTPAFKAKAVEAVQYASIVSGLEKQAAESQHIDKTEDVVKQYLAERPSKLPGFKEAIWRFLTTSVPPDQLKIMQIALNLLQ
jgi:hypothetical protein